MLTHVNGLPVCGNCQEFATTPGALVMEVDGIGHVAPEIWTVGRRLALERDGATPAEAVTQACREWAAHCRQLAEGRS